MSKDSLGRLYDRLTPRERLQLFLGAIDSQDEREVDRLLSTCPRQDYSGPSIEFVTLINDVMKVALTLANQWALYSQRHDRARRAATVLVAAFLAGSKFGWKLAGKEGGWKESRGLAPDEDLVPPVLKEAMDRATSELVGVYAGFRSFCAKARVEPEGILALAAFVSVEIEEMTDLLNGEVTPDAETVAATEKMLWSMWSDKGGTSAY